jgi:glutamate receptor ionotropic, NMDA 3A
MSNLHCVHISMISLFKFPYRSRSDAIDFSTPYFHSGVSLLAAPKVKTDIPLLAFLMPFSPELWIAIFIWLNLTAVAVAIYEWLSPFGLNPWGRMRSKNFSLSSGGLFNRQIYLF